jgi:hypothetical protein
VIVFAGVMVGVFVCVGVVASDKSSDISLQFIKEGELRSAPSRTAT